MHNIFNRVLFFVEELLTGEKDDTTPLVAVSSRYLLRNSDGHFTLLKSSPHTAKEPGDLLPIVGYPEWSSISDFLK